MPVPDGFASKVAVLIAYGLPVRIPSLNWRYEIQFELDMHKGSYVMMIDQNQLVEPRALGNMTLFDPNIPLGSPMTSNVLASLLLICPFTSYIAIRLVSLGNIQYVDLWTGFDPDHSITNATGLLHWFL